MKAYVRTWRFGQDTVMQYHGKEVSYDSAAHVLFIKFPVLDSGRGDITAVTIVAGDEWSSELCGPDCTHHPDEKNGETNIIE